MFTALPSSSLTLTLAMTELKTGEEQSNFVFTGSMDANSPIEKGAALRLKIPGTF